jgi:hypothetical protein
MGMTSHKLLYLVAFISSEVPSEVASFRARLRCKERVPPHHVLKGG